MKHLLQKMASIANELDLNGLEKAANAVTESMLRIAQQTSYLERQKSGQLTTDPYLVQKKIDSAIQKRQTPNQLYTELSMTSARAANDVAAYLKAVGVTANDKPIPYGTNIIQNTKLPQGPNTKIMDFDPLNKNISTYEKDEDKAALSIYDTSRLKSTLDKAVNEAYERYKYLKKQNPQKKSIDIINQLSNTYYWLKDGNRPEYKRFTAKLMKDKGVQKMQDLDVPQGTAGKFK